MKQLIFNNLKNIPGWRAQRKLVVFSVDDYGNVRVDSEEAQKNLQKEGLNLQSRFDQYDTLENKKDLEYLYEVLSSVQDKNGKAAVFTPYALPCNIDFEEIEKDNYRYYHYEQLPDTYQKLTEKDPASYSGSWDLWKEGIEKGLMKPQFHGREHLNLKLFNYKLQNRDHDLMVNLQNRSFAAISDKEFPNIRTTAAFSFENQEDIKDFPKILKTGTDAFEEVFGYRSECFTPPAQEFPIEMEETLSQYGIKHFDKSFHKKRHLGNGKYKREFNFAGRDKKTGLNILVRNVVFEPTNGNKDHVGQALKQIEAAFRWGKPANISSHRVNFCGHIDPKNRKKGLNELSKLLQEIVKRWPDVKFISVDELGKIIETR